MEYKLSMMGTRLEFKLGTLDQIIDRAKEYANQYGEPVEIMRIYKAKPARLIGFVDKVGFFEED